MYLIYPEEIRELERIFEPYMEHCELREDAPQEAKDAFNRFLEWMRKTQGYDQ